MLIEDQKKDSLLFVHKLVASIDSFSIKKSYLRINQLKLDKTFLYINSDSVGTANYQFLIDSFKTKDSSGTKDTLKTDSLNFDLILKQFEFENAKLRYAFRDSSGNHLITLDDISLGLSGIDLHNENLAMQITRFQMNDQKDFKLEDFSARLIATADSIKLLKLHVRTSNSEITEANILIDRSEIGTELNLNKLKFIMNLNKSTVNLKDIGLLVPAMKGMNENIEVSGQISGTPLDLKGKNMKFSMGNNTRLAFDFYVNGLSDLSKAYMQFDLKQSFADFNDLVRVKLPDHFPIQQLNIPESLLQAGVIEYKGNFTGFLSDFVAYGTFSSKWGVLTTDLSFVPTEGKKLKINGRLRTVDFQLGPLFQTEYLDRITFNGDIKGLLNKKTDDFEATVSGQIDSMIVNQYKYKNIQLKGDILNKRFDGSLVADDPNLKFRFEGAFDLNVPVPVFNFNMLVEKADLKALKLVDIYKKSDISFALNANFTGNNIDNVAGSIHFTKGNFRNENGDLTFDNFDLKTSNKSAPVLEIRSDFLDADFRGQYQLHNLHNTFKQILAKFLPSAGLNFTTPTTQNNFDFRFMLKDINRFTKVLIPDLKMNPVEITGNINGNKNTLVLNAVFPEIQYKSTVFKKMLVNIDGNSKLNVRNKVDEISIGDQFKVYNLSFVSEAVGDVLNSKIAWNNFGEVSYSGSINTSTKFYAQKNSPHIEITVKPSRVYLADEQWQINSSSITIDSTLIKINKLKFSSNAQSITADGAIDKNQNNKLNIFFNQIDLNTLNTFISGDINLKGSLNGSLSVFDMYQRTMFLSDLKIDGLALLGQLIGDASIQSRWNPTTEEIDADLLVKSDKKVSLHAFGIFNPGTDSLSVNTDFDHFSLLILQPLMGSTFANFHGDATGKVRIDGPINHIQHNGVLFADHAGLMLTDLRVNYTLNDSVQFKGDRIIFPNIKIQDDLGNSGIFNGSIKHRSFSKMEYDLTIKSQKIMAFNTTSQDNELYYGKAFGSGVVSITGNDAKVLIDGVVRTEKGTNMNFSLDYEGDAQQYDFLSFVNHGYTTPKIEAPVYESNTQMQFKIEITPEAKAQLIYNSNIGEMIRSQGSGNMQLTIDKNNNIALFGEYTVEQGDYLFTLQNVINKKFEIKQGGTIGWNGDPLDATVNLNAIYRVKASLSDLFANSDPTKDYSQRIPVVCKIALSKSLNNPDIKFDIDFSETRIKDQFLQYISSDEDMNKQILSLLVLDKFYTPEYLRGTYTASNTLAGSTATTASELWSNQVSNWLSKISNDFDIGFKYRPGNEITNKEFELALSTQMFNDRVSINGNIANNSSQRTNTNNNNLVGDADINVKLTNNGKLQLKAYNHANSTLIYETSPYTQGVGVSYREEFNDINELWQKVKSIFKRKNSRPVKVKS